MSIIQPKNHGRILLPWFTILLATVITLCFFTFGAMPHNLLFDRKQLLEGEVWRLITGHFAHTDFSHYVWNVLALLILGSILELRYKFTFIKQFGLVLFSGVLISISILWLLPSLFWFAGFSGILNTYFTIFLWRIWQDYRHPATLFVAFGTLSKIIVEAIENQSLVGAGEMPVVFEAHAIGIVGGLILIVGHLISKFVSNDFEQ